MDNFKKIKVLFWCRFSLWMVALAATIYWISWSFKLYAMEYMDEHIYATALRPIMTKGLIISVIAICISFVLRNKSDKIKDIIKYTVE